MLFNSMCTGNTNYYVIDVRVNLPKKFLLRKRLAKIRVQNYIVHHVRTGMIIIN